MYMYMWKFNQEVEEDMAYKNKLTVSFGFKKNSSR